MRFNQDDIKNFLKNMENKYPKLEEAVQGKKLIIFVGAGVSVHLGIPNWYSFAQKYCKFLYEQNNKRIQTINYKTYEILKKEDTKKLLTICKIITNNIIDNEDKELKKDVQNFKENLEKFFKDNFKIEKYSKIEKEEIYPKLYSLDAKYITTNYDNCLDLMAKKRSDILKKASIQYSTNGQVVQEYSKGNIYFEVDDFLLEKIKQGDVVHIHGSLNDGKLEDINNMIISEKDYINRYFNENDEYNKYNEFMKDIFNSKYDILFLGYGLSELEILQYMFKNGEKSKVGGNRYAVVGCYADEYEKLNHLQEYYKKLYNIDLIPYDMTEKGHDGLKSIIEQLCEMKNKDILEITSWIDEVTQNG